MRRKRRLGRPKGSGKPVALVRRNRVSITLNDAELAALNRIARERDVPVSTAAYEILARTLKRRR